MVASSPLVVGPEQRAQLAKLREIARLHPVDMQDLKRRIQTPRGKRLHKMQMTAQSVWIPTAFVVTFSIETGHPAGACRHLSVSSDVRGRLPTFEALWMIADPLGFVGSLQLCRMWLEEGGQIFEFDALPDAVQHGAINVVQPLSISTETEGLPS